MKTGKLKNLATGEIIEVTATTEHPDSHYGRAVWVDKDNVAIMEVEHPPHAANPFYAVVEVTES